MSEKQLRDSRVAMQSDENDGFYVGDDVMVSSHTHGMIARVMALAEGYAMVRYPRCTPFVVPVKELTRIQPG